MPVMMTNCTHINNTQRPLILLGTNSNLYKITEICSALGIKVAGIIDSDYFGNTEKFCGVDVIDRDETFDNPVQLEHYRKNFNFFCAVNWAPMQDPITVRNRQKRDRYLWLIMQHQLNCVSIVAPMTWVSPSASIGIGSFVDHMVHVESNVKIGDFVTVYAKTHIGHDAVIGHNCVLQRMCVAPSSSIIESEVYFGPMVKALKDGARFGKGTFIHEGVYIRRGTRDHEIITLDNPSLKRVESSLDNCL